MNALQDQFITALRGTKIPFQLNPTGPKAQLYFEWTDEEAGPLKGPTNPPAGETSVVTFDPLEGQDRGIVFCESGYPQDWLKTPSYQGVLHPKLTESYTLALLDKVKALKSHFDMDLEIHWVWHTEQVQIEAIRPLNECILRDELFSYENLSDVFSPTTPRLLAECLATKEEEIFSAVQDLDPALPEERIFVDCIQGQAGYNRSFLEEIYTSWKRESPFRQTLTSAKPLPQKSQYKALKDKARLLRLQERIQRISDQMMETFLIPHSRLSGYALQVQEIQMLWARESVALMDAMYPVVNTLKNQGILEQWPWHTFLVAGKILAPLESLRQSIQQTIAALGQKPTPKEMLRNPDFRMAWKIFMSDFGHWAFEPNNLACPRFDENSGPLMKSLMMPWHMAPSAEENSLKGKLNKPLWKLINHLFSLKHQLYSDAVWALYQVKKQMHPLILEQVEAGRLKTAEQFWTLGLEQVRALEAGESVSPVKKQHRGEHFYRFSDFEPGLGVGLSGGEREGVIWRPTALDMCAPEGFQPWTTILCVPHLHPGLWPCLKQASAVIVEASGPVDYSTLMLMESAIPALAMPQANTRFQTGDRVLFDAEQGTCEVKNVAESVPDC